MDRTPDEQSIHLDGTLVALPEGATRLDLPRADRLWTALVKERVVVASGETFLSPHTLPGHPALHDQAIGRPNDKLWGSRIDPAYVGAPVFAAIASCSAGHRWVLGRRLSVLARRFLAAGPDHAFVGVDGELSPRAATALGDALMEAMLSAPYEPLSVVVKLLPKHDGKLVVLGNAQLSFARALEMVPQKSFAAVAARRHKRRLSGPLRLSRA